MPHDVTHTHPRQPPPLDREETVARTPLMSVDTRAEVGLPRVMWPTLET